jgi:hypothetical protein
MIDKKKPIARLGVTFAAKLIEQRFDKTALADLTEKEFADLNSMSEREIFEAILEWEGILGYTDLLITMHEQLWPAIADCRCPECGSLDIRKGDLNDVGSTIDVPSVCRNCGEELRLVYDLRRVDRELSEA